MDGSNSFHHVHDCMLYLWLFLPDRHYLYLKTAWQVRQGAQALLPVWVGGEFCSVFCWFLQLSCCDYNLHHQYGVHHLGHYEWQAWGRHRHHITWNGAWWGYRYTYLWTRVSWDCCTSLSRCIICLMERLTPVSSFTCCHKIWRSLRRCWTLIANPGKPKMMTSQACAP